MTGNVCCCTPDADVCEAEKLMSDNQVRRLPIIENNKIIGILTLGDLAANQSVEDKGVNDTLNNICRCNEKNAE